MLERDVAVSCFGKQRHPHKRAAVLAAHRQGEPGLGAYYCAICCGWHVGHASRRIKAHRHNQKRARRYRYQQERWDI